MTDKEFDSLLKDALVSEEVPEKLNASLLEKAKKKNNFKLLRFTKPASAVAAVFVCAVAVLSFYNHDMDRHTESTPQIEVKSVETEKEEAALPEEEAIMEAAEKENTAPSSEKAVESKTVVREEKKTAPTADVITTEAAPDEAPHAEDTPVLPAASGGGGGGAALFTADTSADTEQTEAATENTFMMRQAAAPSLSAMFNDGYDYKSVINEKISVQISALPNSEEYTFTGIEGDEAFSLNDENLLTVIFAPGKILPEDHGEQFFTVGTVENGVLR